MRIQSLKNLEWYTVTQAGQLLNMSPSTVRRAINEGKLKAFRDGKIFRVSKEHLNDYIARGCKGELN